MIKQVRNLFLSVLFIWIPLLGSAQQLEYTQTPGLLSALSVFYGILAFTIIVTLAQFFISKDKAYLYYGFYVGVGFFLYGIWQEIDFNLFGLEEKYGFKQIVFHGGIPLALMGYALYCKFVIEFLNLRQKKPFIAKRLQQVFKILLLIIFIDQIIYCTLRYCTPNIYEQVYPIIRICFLIFTAVICLYAIAQIFRVKNRLATIILLGTAIYFSVSLIGFYIYAIARNTEDSSMSNIHPTFLNQIGFLCEIVVFSIGLGYRMKIVEEEKEIAYTNYIKQLGENKLLEIAKTQAEKKQEIDRIRSKFYTNITHEFRTPLTVIIGMTERIKNHDIEQNLISRNSKNLLRLINQLLDLSKLESGHLKIKQIQGDIVTYLRYLTESFYSMAVERKVKLGFETTVSVLVMDYDADKLQHIVYNLLSNALKFTREGGTVSLHLSKEEPSHLVLQVKDTGKGMSKDQLPYIFDRFYQVEDSSTRPEEGTGIGLALTKELIELMNGSISVESELGLGTTFKIRLPISNVAPLKELDVDEFNVMETPTVNIPTEPAIEESTDVSDHQTLPKILLIEDNSDVAIYIKQLLSDVYKIDWAADGEKGIQQAIEDLPDLIISDVMMPKKDGYEVCRTLKTDERTSHIPIILLTAKALQSDKITGLKHGADAYLMKPFDKEELLIRLDKLHRLRQTLLEKYSQQDYTQHIATPKEPSLEDIFLQKVRDAIEPEIGNAHFSIPDLCKALYLSNIQLYRKLKALTGKTPSQFIRSYRLQKAKYLIQTSSLNISEIAYDLGFTDPAYFTRVFKKEFGVTPSQVSSI